MQHDQATSLAHPMALHCKRSNYEDGIARDVSKSVFVITIVNSELRIIINDVYISLTFCSSLDFKIAEPLIYVGERV